jgi:hypothetical protein
MKRTCGNRIAAVLAGMSLLALSPAVGLGQSTGEQLRAMQKEIEALKRRQDLGVSNPKDPSVLRATYMIDGAQPYVVFQNDIDSLLSSARAGAGAAGKASK